MSKVKWKGSTLLAPLPAVLVSCGSAEEPNLITIAWTGILSSQPPVTYISVRPERYSYDIIKNNREFVINIPSSRLVRSVDMCGVRSGKDINKFKECGLRAEPSFEVSCPSVADCPLSLECRVREIIPLGSHDVFMADIVAVAADEQYIDEKGKLRLDKCSLTAYAHGEYFALGKKIGNFGFSVKKKRTKKTNKK